MNKFNPLDYPISFTQPIRLAPSTWIMHVPFAMFIVDILRPAVLVELGTQYGVSYCAFCQAINSLELNARCYAIDTWAGDEHAGYYGDEVLIDLKKNHDPLYSNFSELIKGTFDAALDRFEDGTIDLLHIDGYHTYEAVKRDFYNWLPKMSARGVILFHDIAVKEADFGVWKFWDEHKLRYPHFDFSHGYGLGILLVGEQIPSGLDLLLKETANLSLMEEFFLQMGLRLEREYLLSEQVTQQERTLQQIFKSKSWKLMLFLQRIRGWFSPSATGVSTNAS